MATKVVAMETAPSPWTETRGCGFLMEGQNWVDELNGVRGDLGAGGLVDSLLQMEGYSGASGDSQPPFFPFPDLP